MKRKYKYNTLPKREVFVEHLLEKISDEHKDFVDLILDCNRWHERDKGMPLFSNAQIQLATVYLHLRYSNLQTYVEDKIDDFNESVNEVDTGSHIVEENVI